MTLLLRAATALATPCLWPAAAALLLGALAAPAGAAPVLWSTSDGGNGHAYAYVDASVDWATARAQALASSFGGVKGHLANVTSAAENAFLGSLSSDGWLGGSDAAEEGVWRWVEGAEAGQTFWLGGANGTATGYASWYPGEPNNQGDEDYLHRLGGTWNDLPAWRNLGYYIEYDLAPVAAPVPEPGGLALAAAGLLALAGMARRRTQAGRSADAAAARA